MFFSLSIIALTSPLFFGAVSATPTIDWKFAVGWDGVTLDGSAIGIPVNSTGLEKRVLTNGVFICVDSNWGPPCGYAQQPLGECIVLGSDWANKISSFGPDPGQQCTVYSGPHCSSDTPITQFIHPGDPTGGIGTPMVWNDKIESWLCELLHD